jgi:hypothetical protein
VHFKKLSHHNPAPQSQIWFQDCQKAANGFENSCSQSGSRLYNDTIRALFSIRVLRLSLSAAAAACPFSRTHSLQRAGSPGERARFQSRQIGCNLISGEAGQKEAQN